MVRDSVQLETAVNTISHEYLLEFTSEYSIPEMLHPELPGPGDRIVDFPEGKVDECVFPTVVDWQTNDSKDGMPANGTYSVEAVRVLDTHRTPIQKQPKMLLCLVGIIRRYYMGDEVYSTFHYDDDRFDSCPKSDKGEDWEPPRAPHEVPLLTLTAARVIEMDEPAAATDSSGVPSAVEKSLLDFAHEDGASDQGTTALEVPPPEDVLATAAPEVGQSKGAVAADPPVARESRKRGHDGIDATAPPKLLRRDHAGLRPSGAPADVSDPDPLSFANVPSSQGVAAAGDPEFENVSSPAEVGSPGSVYWPEWGVTNGILLDTPEACQDLVDHAAHSGYFFELRHMHNEDFLGQYNINLAQQVARRDQRIQARESKIKNLEALLETEAGMKRAAEEKSAGLSQELERMRAQFSELQVSNERLSQQVDALQQQVSGEETLKAAFEEYKRQQDQLAFADVVSAGVAKEMRQAFADVVSAGVEHGHAQLTVESLEAYDPEAEAKFAAALQLLKDLKYPLLDQLEGLKDAHMDVIMAALYLESDTGGMPHNLYATSVPAPLSSPSPCTRRSDGVPVSVPTVVPQGLALLLVDAASQTDLEDA
nr:hypothetical protein [Tanacetum cinerariifolium]